VSITYRAIYESVSWILALRFDEEVRVSSQCGRDE
jgi:hypothetical protein